MKESRVWIYCPLCGVNIDWFIGSGEEYRRMKMLHICHRCNASLHCVETIIREVEKGVLAPYQITVD